MANEKSEGVATEKLASRISGCIAEADAHDLHVVAAYLDVALNALRGVGLEPSSSEYAPHSSLH